MVTEWRVAPTISTFDNTSDRNNSRDVILKNHQRVEILNSHIFNNGERILQK